MVRALHGLLALLLLFTPVAVLAESHSTLGIHVERSLTQQQDEVSEQVAITIKDLEQRRAEINKLPTRLRLSLMWEHGRLLEAVDLQQSLAGYETGRALSEDETRFHWFILPVAFTLPLYLYWGGNPLALALGASFTVLSLATVFVVSATMPAPELPDAFQQSLIDHSWEYAEGAKIGFSVSTKNKRMNLVLLGTLTGVAVFGLALATLDRPESRTY